MHEKQTRPMQPIILVYSLKVSEYLSIFITNKKEGIIKHIEGLFRSEEKIWARETTTPD